MPLSREEIIRTVLAARMRISAAAWEIVRDADAAEDIFQNVSVKMLAGNQEFDAETQVISWAHVTARHEALNWLRRHKGRTTSLDHEVLELLESEWAIEKPAAHSSSVEALRKCLDDLPERSQRILRLRYFEGQSCGDVSRALGIKLDAVYQRLARLHRALQKCIERRLGTSPLPPGAETT